MMVLGPGLVQLTVPVWRLWNKQGVFPVHAGQLSARAGGWHLSIFTPKATMMTAGQTAHNLTLSQAHTEWAPDYTSDTINICYVTGSLTASPDSQTKELE